MSVLNRKIAILFDFCWVIAKFYLGEIMSEFDKSVYMVVQNIPCGFVMNYAMVTELAGYPTKARQVGRALHHNPDPANIPCHRVVMKDGSLTPAFVFGGENEQRKRLESEGVTFKGDKVDMAEHLVQINRCFR